MTVTQADATSIGNKKMNPEEAENILSAQRGKIEATAVKPLYYPTGGDGLNAHRQEKGVKF